MLLSNYAIKFRPAVFVFVLVLTIAGIASYVNLPREGTPDITIPFVFVSAFYEGTAPSEMEKLVSVPLEDSLNDLEGVKEMRSTTSEGVAAVSIEFVAGEDIDLARQRVKDKVDLAKPDLPADLDEPIVDAFNFGSDFPVFIFALSGDATPARLKNLAEDIQDRIDDVPGVKQVSIAGVREREVRVEVDLTRLVAYDLPLGTLMRRIAEENKTVSAGNIETEGNKFQVRIPGEFVLVSDIRDIIVAYRAGQPVYLRDVASVEDTFKDLSSVARLNGEAAVSLDVKKRSGENAVSLIDRVKDVLDAYTLPEGITLTVVMDQSEYVAMMLRELENNVATGFFLVVVVLFIFMGWRNSLFVAFAIPFSMLIAFTVLSITGQALNMIVLFSLVLAVGMLVDNAIVIVENIYRNAGMGIGRTEAARRGASEVAWPVITSTLTTCAAFSPLLFWPDVMGQFMGFLPRTLIITLFASLFVAIVINPAVCSALIGTGRRRAMGDGEEAKRHPFVRGYERLLTRALQYRVPVFLLGVLFLIVTVQMYGLFGRGVELFPETDPRNATVEVRFPQGTALERTSAALRDIEAQLGHHEDVKFYLSRIGLTGGDMMPGAGGASGAHVGTIHVEFKDAEDRTGSSAELVETIRKEIGAVAGAEVKVEKEREGPPTGSPVAIEISGDDFETLAITSARVMERIQTVPGLVDLRDDWEEALPELQFRVDRHRAALLGLDTTTIGSFLRMSIYGLETSKFRADEDEFDITVRTPEAQRETLDLLDRLFIPVPGGESVALSSLGTVVYAGGRGAINRKDQKRVITISGNNAGRGVDKIIEDVKARVEEIDLPPGYAVDYAGDDQEMQESGAFLARAFAVALGLILVILVIQFNSPLLPGIILFSVLLSLIGVMWGLLICRMRFGVIMTGVGVISLAGIVVNNAIVLIDCILQRRRDGLDVIEAVIVAGRLRLRPVLLTAATTVLGLIPMAIGYSVELHEWPPRFIAGTETSSWWAPMAVAVIFGLALSTVLTLVLVPVMYSLADSLVRRLRVMLGMPAERESV